MDEDSSTAAPPPGPSSLHPQPKALAIVPTPVPLDLSLITFSNSKPNRYSNSNCEDSGFVCALILHPYIPLRRSIQLWVHSCRCLLSAYCAPGTGLGVGYGNELTL